MAARLGEGFASAYEYPSNCVSCIRGDRPLIRRFAPPSPTRGEGTGGAASAWNPDRQIFDAAHEAGIEPLRLAHHLDGLEALQDLLPDNAQLQLGEAHADAAVDAEAE